MSTSMQRISSAEFLCIDFFYASTQYMPVTDQDVRLNFQGDNLPDASVGSYIVVQRHAPFLFSPSFPNAKPSLVYQ